VYGGTHRRWLFGASFGAVYFAVLRRKPELVLYVASALTGAVVLVLLGSPWVGGKSLATASPALVAAAMIGAAALFETRQLQIVGIVGLLAVAGGVLWSNVLQVHDVELAPRGELAELSRIGTTFAGQGPALMTDYSPYGSRHFLRQLAPESASEYRWRLIPLLNGKGLEKGSSAEIDAFQTDGVLVYRTLVLRRSDFSTPRPRSLALARSFPGLTPETPRPPRFLGDPCARALLSDPGGTGAPWTPGRQPCA